MNREYYLKELLIRAEGLRRYSYEEILYVELDANRVLLLVTGMGCGRRYVGDLWSGTFTSFSDMDWKEVSDDQSPDY